MTKRPSARTLTVIESRQLTPSMRRVTLGGPGLAGFPPDQTGGYVKLYLGIAASGKPTVRTYTIRNQRPDAIELDFALHGGSAAGPATRWALAARPGDTIEVGGPGAAKPLPGGHDFYLVAGDMTALPAIGANLERLKDDARGLVAIEVQVEADRVALASPPGMTICWLVNPEPGKRPELLADALRAADLPSGRIAGWAAAEFGAMRSLRALLRDELKLPNGSLYVSSYWKHGLIEDEHKLAKREDSDRQAA
ncbi:siderophore-interacting protein [Pseudoblastomonas halimionae]|uniref:Siderophore-interacting protein n=1 Tax=Alteriqipengyuania halimionae TaxID=1926630 RepID=A0A6I4U2A6_9SPHN|nr:siderophore-interacting protein [Alteriqipengyuania halimionae]MXP09063.1 siderophore-interacting protein [Alteriqipengyuania halimionae]